MDFSAQVAAGVAFLDETITEWDWRRELKTGGLDLTDPFRCALALAFAGDYWATAQQYSGHDRSNFAEITDWAAARGFTVADDAYADEDDLDEVWNDLQAAWEAELGI